MKSILLTLLLLNTVLFASSEAILKLDTQGHTGLIWDILVSKDKSEIISASDDKTIRVWDSKTGREKRKILGAIGSGNEGQIFSIALSDDEMYLAVGGFFDQNADKKTGAIRIYNYKTGKLLKVLKSHTGIVIALSFSSDDNYLVSGSGDKKVKIWQTSNWKLKESISFHTNDVYAVKMIKKDIATCGSGKEILIFDRELNLKKSIKCETEPTGLAYSPDGKSLVAGSSSDVSYEMINIYETKNYKKTASFKKHTNLTMAVNFIDNKTPVSGGGDNKEIYIWDRKTAKQKTKIVGVGESVWSVGIKGDEISWGNKWTGDSHTIGSKLQKSINLKDFKINGTQNSFGANHGFRRSSTTNATWSLKHSKGGDYDYRDAVLEIKKSGILKSKIVKSATTGFRHNCYGWYKDFIISGGAGGHLKIYNRDGKELASLVGHTGEVWSIAVDGDRFVSGSDDQTMKVWDLSQIDNTGLKYDEIFIKSIMNQYNITRDNVLAHAKKINDNDIYLVNKIYPTLSIFVSKDNEFVAYTKEGFFTSSKNGAKYIGYHINQGADKEARYLSVDKFYDSFYRPDLIQKALNGEDLSKYAKEVNIDSLISSGLAPEVKIVTNSKTSKKRDINLNLEVCTIDDGGYDNLTLYLNGMAVEVMGKDRALKLKKQSRIRKECFNISKLISLTNGKNTIGFKATNRAGNIESNLDEITVNYKGRSNKKPNLYVLAIGIDKYRDGDLWLNYSKADAKEFTKAIQKASKPLFKNIYTYQLLDKEVTKSKILDMFSKIGAKTNREDVFMLYMAGHGITDAKTGAYFYLPVDFRYKNENSVRKSGMSQNDFKLGLSKIQAMKSLTILDTCNSGSFAEAMASRGILQKTAINKLTRATGRATIVASSKDQVALEGYKGHGVFTYTLMEALKGKGYGSDDKITIKELAGYIEDVLPDRTYEKWGYEQVPQSNITGNDFPIGVK